MNPSLRLLLVGGAATLSLALAGCGKQSDDQAPPAAEVTIATATSAPVQLTDDLPGRIVAYRVAEIRPQVGGLIQRRLFVEGAEVRAGAPLFQINPAPFRADLETAAGALRRAEATRSQARTQVERLRPLIEGDAISRQSFDNAVATFQQADADVAAAQATVQRRRLDLGFATITAPISGRIGATAVTEGALVSQTGADALATIQQIDKVYVDVRQPASRLEALKTMGGGGDAMADILDADGAPTGLRGRILFSELLVDPGTGDLRARVLVENGGQTLLPGMFVRVRLPRGVPQRLVRAPQQAIFIAGGKPQVMVLDARGVPQTRAVVLGPVIDGHYAVLEGLNVSDRVVVEGRDRIQPNTPIKTSVWKPASAAQPQAQR
jgi:multidrug efflux system membrane fusion protein